jgi:beta-galactosidase
MRTRLGTQYYRPPFPESTYWDDDIRAMADAGLTTVQLWVVWAWVEATPDTYEFGDYDCIVELADKHGLDVVLSTIAAVHPYWIHRVVPGSEMVDNFGHPVVSSNRGEIHYGLTPGGCLDNPGVWARMSRFLTEVVTRYRGASNLAGWDAWNELRWNVQADGLVCYCPHTIAAFRRRLDEKHGGLDGLNAAWKRRYSSWDDVFPGKMPNRPYTELMAFEHFLTDRSIAHAKSRYDVMKALDPDHPVTVHDAAPTVFHGADAYPTATALHRGNDWYLADHTDGVGCSSFPLWGGREISEEEFHVRLDSLASAAQGKRIWLSELQGGRYNMGFAVGQSVDPVHQQRWIWNGFAVGAESVLFWCWRDEVFGRESNGFGFAGNDGLYPERKAAMQKTGRAIREHDALLASYTPDAPRVGIFFSPQSYYLYWAQDGHANVPMAGLLGYGRGLTRIGIPYTVVEEGHLGALDRLTVLFMPRSQVLDDETAERLAAWVNAGGILVAESETGAFRPNGLYRYPDDRPLLAACGAREVGRRILDGQSLAVRFRGREYQIPATQWRTPMVSGSDAAEADALELSHGNGTMLFVGTYAGDPYRALLEDGGSPTLVRGFEEFLRGICSEAGVAPPVRLDDSGEPAGFYARTGISGERRLAFLFLPTDGEEYRVRFGAGVFPAGEATELVTGNRLALETDGEGLVVTVPPTEWGVAVLASG